MARRRRKKRARLSLRQRGALLALRKPLLKVGLFALCALLSLNSAVRVLGGGDPHWLSPLHVPDKTRALLALAAHTLSHGPACEQVAVFDLVARAARRNGVPEQLALAVARTESSFDAHAISRTGAMGLMQLMPGTADALGVRDAFDPTENTDAAARYLAQLTRRYRGDRMRAVAAYNLGPARVPASGALALPGETRTYVRRVLGERLASPATAAASM